MAAGTKICWVVVGLALIAAGLSLLGFAMVLASWESESLSWFYGAKFFEPIGVLSYRFDFYAEPDPDADGSVLVGTCDDYTPVDSRRGLSQNVCNDIEFEFEDDPFTFPVTLSTNMIREGIGDPLPIQNPTFAGMRFSATDCEVPPVAIDGWTDVQCGTCLPVPGTVGYAFVGYRIECGGLQSNLNRFLLAVIVGSGLLLLGILTICCGGCGCRLRLSCGCSDTKESSDDAAEPLLRNRRYSLNSTSSTTPPLAWDAERVHVLEQRLKEADERAEGVKRAAAEEQSRVLFVNEGKMRSADERVRAAEATAAAAQASTDAHKSTIAAFEGQLADADAHRTETIADCGRKISAAENRVLVANVALESKETAITILEDKLRRSVEVHAERSPAGGLSSVDEGEELDGAEDRA